MIFLDIKTLFFQAIKFGMVGCINTVTSLGIYYICVFLGMHYLIAYALGFIISVLVAYILNKTFVFESKAQTRSSLIKTYVVYGATFLLGQGMLILMIDGMSISDKIAPLIVTVINLPINFFCIKLWAMK